MAEFQQIIFFLILLGFCKENFSLPVQETINQPVSSPPRPFRERFSKMTNARNRRAEEGQQSGGVGELMTTAIKGMGDRVLSLLRPFVLDGIAASSALNSPTMFVGGFSVMMQPMPNGSEFAGQLMQMAPHYMNLLPGAGKK